MKNIIILFFIISPISFGFGLSVKKDTFGDMKIFITQDYQEAQLIVYITDIPDLAKNREDIWQWVKDSPDISVYITNIKSAADLTVYFTSLRSRSGWLIKEHPLRNKLKK